MRYKIWNKADSLYTVTGQKFLPADYIRDHAAWADIPGVKCVIADMPCNLAVFMEFEAMKAHYRQLGVEFGNGMGDQEILDAISAWEENPPAPMPSPEERMAAAMEFQNLLSM